MFAHHKPSFFLIHNQTLSTFSLFFFSFSTFFFQVALLRDLATAPASRMAMVAVFGITHRLGDALRAGWVVKRLYHLFEACVFIPE
jgi:hypothetical protein